MRITSPSVRIVEKQPLWCCSSPRAISRRVCNPARERLHHITRRPKARTCGARFSDRSRPDLALHWLPDAAGCPCSPTSELRWPGSDTGNTPPNRAHLRRSVVGSARRAPALPRGGERVGSHLRWWFCRRPVGTEKREESRGSSVERGRRFDRLTSSNDSRTC